MHPTPSTPTLYFPVFSHDLPGAGHLRHPHSTWDKDRLPALPKLIWNKQLLIWTAHLHGVEKAEGTALAAHRCSCVPPNCPKREDPTTECVDGTKIRLPFQALLQWARWLDGNPTRLLAAPCTAFRRSKVGPFERRVLIITRALSARGGDQRDWVVHLWRPVYWGWLYVIWLVFVATERSTL